MRSKDVSALFIETLLPPLAPLAYTFLFHLKIFHFKIVNSGTPVPRNTHDVFDDGRRLTPHQRNATVLSGANLPNHNHNPPPPHMYDVVPPLITYLTPSPIFFNHTLIFNHIIILDCHITSLQNAR